MVLIFSLGVASANIEFVNNLISIVSPEVASMFQSINMVSEDQGIKMEVVAAMNDDEMAVIYVTMQDLKGNRIDETLDIYNYSLSGASMFNNQIVDYDEGTKTATLKIQANGGKRMNGRRATFRIDSFLTDKKIFDRVNTGINLSNVPKISGLNTILLDMDRSISGGGGDLFEELNRQGSAKILKIDETDISLPNIDFARISNIGFIDDRLHIQVKWIGEGKDDHGYFYLADDLGRSVSVSSSISFGVDESGNTQYGWNYNEYIFELGDVDLQNLKLMGYFVTNGNYIEGNWKTTFKMESVKEEKTKECNLKFDTWTAHRISISPLGVTLVGKADRGEIGAIDITVNMMEGNSQSLESSKRLTEDQEMIIKFSAPNLLDISEIKSITIEGKEIYFD